jgi:hypothetical protein
MAITIKNVSSSDVSIWLPGVNFNRTFTPGRKVIIDKDVYDVLCNDPGTLALIRGHYIKVEGIEDTERVEEETSPVFDVAAIEAFFTKNDITGFAKFIPTATAAEKETVVRLAVDRGITNTAFTALIKKYCDVDVISAINMKHQAEEK